MGNVVHNLPLVGDLRASLPECRIDRVVEESFGVTTRLLEKI